MLLIHAESACDICMEEYASNELDPLSAPHSIACGHIFCLQCLQALNELCCPLCRANFTRDDIRLLRFDLKAAGRRSTDAPRDSGSSPKTGKRGSSPAISIDATEEDDFDHCSDFVEYQAAVLLGRLRQTIESSQFPGNLRDRRTIELLESSQNFLRSHSERRYEELRTMCYLFQHVMYLQAQERERAHEMEQQTEDLQAALAVGESLREQLRHEDTEWSKKYQLALRETDRLWDELAELRSRPRPGVQTGAQGQPIPRPATFGDAIPPFAPRPVQVNVPMAGPRTSRLVKGRESYAMSPLASPAAGRNNRGDCVLQ